MLVHAALAAFWNDVRDSVSLGTLDDPALTARIATAAESARQGLKEERWRWVPPVIAAGEASRIAVLLRHWIDAYERTRPPFAVEATEVQAEVTLAGVSFRLRLDRVDRVSGGAAIIDYKTGLTLPPKAWFDPRPRSRAVRTGPPPHCVRPCRGPGCRLRTARHAGLRLR